MLALEYHEAGLIKIVAHMLQDRRHRLSTIDVPVIVVDFGHPDLCALYNFVQHTVQASGLTEIKHRDIHIIHVDITSTGQGYVRWCIQCGRKYISIGETLTLTPYIAQQYGLICDAGLLGLYHLYQTGIGCEQRTIQPQFHKGAVGTGTIHSTLQSPIFIDLVICSFLAKIGLAEEIGGTLGAFVAQELSIHIELTDIA